MEKSPIQKKLSWALGCALLGAALALAFPVRGHGGGGPGRPGDRLSGRPCGGCSLSGGGGERRRLGDRPAGLGPAPWSPGFCCGGGGGAVEDWLAGPADSPGLRPALLRREPYADRGAIGGGLPAPGPDAGHSLHSPDLAGAPLPPGGWRRRRGRGLVSAVSALLTGCALVRGPWGRGPPWPGTGGPRRRRPRQGTPGTPASPWPSWASWPLLRLGPYLLGAAALLWGRAAGGPGGPGALRPGDGRALRPGRLRLPDGGPGVRPAVSGGVNLIPAGPLRSAGPVELLRVPWTCCHLALAGAMFLLRTAGCGRAWPSGRTTTPSYRGGRAMAINGYISARS